MLRLFGVARFLWDVILGIRTLYLGLCPKYYVSRLAVVQTAKREIEWVLCVPSAQSQKKRASVKDALFLERENKSSATIYLGLWV